MKYIIFFIFLIILATSCTESEPKLNKRQQIQIQKMVDYRIDSMIKAQQSICYEAVLTSAQPISDSIILEFEYEVINESLDKPVKPSKPAKPKVNIPEFKE